MKSRSFLLKHLLLLGTLAFLTQSCADKSDEVESYFGFNLPKATIDRHIEEQMAQLGMPGLSFALINDGQVVHHNTFGYANLETQTKVSNNTIFEAASLSKPMFAYFAMTFVDEGILDLDTPLYTYQPHPDIEYDERYKQITARMVLCHRSGFPNWRNDTPGDKLKIHFDPGTDFLYSGEGYMYLGKVLCHLKNTDWEGLEVEYQSRVASPLGMEHTVFIQDSFSMKHKAEPYDEDGQWISPDRDPERQYRFEFRPPASVHSEAIDFSKWLIALMNKKGLKESSFDELFRVHSYVNEFNSIKVDYTLGFYKPRIPLTNLYLHGGNNYGFTSFFAADPDSDWGFVLFTNSEYGEQLGNELLLYLFFGPNLTILYILLGVLALSIIAFLFFGIRFFIRVLRRKKGA
ncbi:MAG: serine hydrolase domain-containing protein [Bacteroidota bacterium]